MHLNYVSIWIANGWKTGYGESLSWSPIWEKKEFPTQKSTHVILRMVYPLSMVSWASEVFLICPLSFILSKIKQLQFLNATCLDKPLHLPSGKLT